MIWDNKNDIKIKNLTIRTLLYVLKCLYFQSLEESPFLIKIL